MITIAFLAQAFAANCVAKSFLHISTRLGFDFSTAHHPSSSWDSSLGPLCEKRKRYFCGPPNCLRDQNIDHLF